MTTISIHSEKERKALKASAFVGLALALGVDLIWLFGIYPAMPQDNPWALPIILLTCITQTALTTAGAIGFTWTHMKLKVNTWLAIPYGALIGALAGGISLGISIGLRTVCGRAAGIIVYQGEMAYMNSAPWWQVFGDGFIGGFGFGLTALIPGAIGALVLSFAFRSRKP